MRALAGIVLLTAGCSGLFEENPGFREENDTETSGVGGTASGSTVAATESESGSEEDDTTAPAVCDGDENEPNDIRLDGTNLPGTTTAEAPLMIVGELDAAADEDWFKFGGRQVGEIEPAPTARVEADIQVEVCVFVHCAESTGETVECITGTPQTIENIDGCCSIGEATASIRCEGSDDHSSFAYARLIKAEPAAMCVPYTAEVSYRQ